MEHPILMQRIEAGFLLIASVFLYFHLNFNILYFVPALFLIDVFMAGYLLGKDVGAYVYNLGHSFIIPSVLFIIGVPAANDLLIGLGLIWVAHIGIDRALGYGLKHKSAFTDTHLGRIGKQ